MPDQSGFPDPVGLATHKDDRMGELFEWAKNEELLAATLHPSSVRLGPEQGRGSA